MTEQPGSGLRRDLVLSGPMGAGKTTLGRRLARTLSLRFSDLDQRIVEREECSIDALFAASEARFRDVERSAVQAWLNRPPHAPPELLALGGGTLEDAELASALAARATIVGLSASARELNQRLGESGRAARPLLAGSEAPVEILERLCAARRDGYARAAVQVATDGLDPAAAEVAVLRALYDPNGGPWSEQPQPLCPELPAAAGVVWGRGALQFDTTPRAALLWDANLPAVQSEPLRRACQARAAELIELPIAGGEAAKSADTLLGAWRLLLARGVDKDTPLWVAGGGTIGDLGGFVAHTFKRGLPLDLLPTTLLAQLDAALGGKNGINLEAAKNAVGTTRLPRTVTIDPLYLLTLSDAELRGALAEAIKSGLIGDPGLVATIERETEPLRERQLATLEQIAHRAARVKLGIVSRDLEERDERRLLNFGHTLGHALEAVGARHQRPIAHGAAVAIGMVFATYLAARLQLLEEHSLLERLPGLLTRLGLPTAPPPMDDGAREELLGELRHDKKRQAGANVWVLPIATGRLVCRAVEPRQVAETLELFT